MNMIASAGQANEWCEQFLAVAHQFRRLSDDATLGRNQAGAALIEDDRDHTWHVPHLFPRDLEVQIAGERLFDEEVAAVQDLAFGNMAAESPMWCRVLV